MVSLTSLKTRSELQFETYVVILVLVGATDRLRLLSLACGGTNTASLVDRRGLSRAAKQRAKTVSPAAS